MHDGIEHAGTGHTHEHTHEHSHSGDSHEHAHTHYHEHDGGHTHEEEGHPHTHGDHDHSHSHGEGVDKNVALLGYMLDHNTHHAEELSQMAKKLREAGLGQAADEIDGAVSEFQKGNEKLARALAIVKGA